MPLERVNLQPCSYAIKVSYGNVQFDKLPYPKTVLSGCMFRNHVLDMLQLEFNLTRDQALVAWKMRRMEGGTN